MERYLRCTQLCEQVAHGLFFLLSTQHPLFFRGRKGGERLYK